MLTKDHVTNDFFSFKNDLLKNYQRPTVHSVDCYFRSQTGDLDIDIWHNKLENAYATLNLFNSKIHSLPLSWENLAKYDFKIRMPWEENGSLKHERPDVVITVRANQSEQIGSALELIKELEQIDPASEKEFLQKYKEFVASCAVENKSEPTLEPEYLSGARFNM